MKTILKIFAAVMLVSVCSCDPEDVMHPKDICSWTIVNHSGQDTFLHTPLSDDHILVRGELKEGESIVFLDEFGVSKRQTFFEAMIAYLNSRYNSCAVSIYSSDGGELLKEWTIDDRNASGRQFFDEGCWTKKTWSDERYTYHDFTFELLPEDIVQ